MKELTNDDLILETKAAVRHERESAARVIKYFQEIYDRRLHLESGYPNLFEMVTKLFGYCAGSAMRRINVMRLIQEIPEVELKLESGELTLSTASEVQSFFYFESRNKSPYTLEAKRELIETCLKKSKREVERELARRNPEREKRESVRVISNDRVRVSLSISSGLNEKLNHLKDLLAFVDPSMTTEALLERLVDLGLDKFDPVRKAERAARRARSKETIESKTASQSDTGTRSESCNSLPPAEVRSRYIRAKDRHQVVMKSCDFVDGKTGHRCGSTRALQYDHIIPYSHGGANEAENLQPMCAQHNRFRWENRVEQARGVDLEGLEKRGNCAKYTRSGQAHAQRAYAQRPSTRARTTSKRALSCQAQAWCGQA